MWRVSAALVCFTSVIVFAQVGAPPAKPSAQIDLRAIDYHEPSLVDRLADGESSLSLNFVDASHVLLTFNRKGLFHRLSECPPEHQDRVMHAAILELPGGKVVKESDWYVHDRRPYLWPLGPGRFLLRKLNELYEVDSDLHEKLLLRSPRELLWVSVTPDARQIVIETANDAKAQPPAPPPPKFIAQFLDARTMAPDRTVPLEKAVSLSGTSAGYIDFQRKGDVWLLRFGPTAQQRHNLARVRSHTVPAILYSSNNTLLVGRCPAPNCDYSVSALTVTGHHLWRQHWTGFRASPVVTRIEDGSRFGVSTLKIAPDTTPHKTNQFPSDESDPFQTEVQRTDVFQQQILVIETATGDPVLSLTVNPAVQSGQNFSLSPDGRRAAVLQHTVLELYDLLPASEQEQAKFAALKNDVPDTYSLGSNSDQGLAPGNSAGTTPVASTATVDDAITFPTEMQDDADAAIDETADASHPSTAFAGKNPHNLSESIISKSQNSPAIDQSITTFKVSTKAVLVDVVVTDNKGHPIRGLRQQDFQLAEDGKAQDIRSFREFTDKELPGENSTAVQSISAPASPPLHANSPNVFSNNSYTADRGAVTVILFDLLNTPQQDQNYARQQLIKFLESKPKNSQVALCTLSTGLPRLKLIQGFTPDETVLLAAAKGKKAATHAARWQQSNMATQATINNVGQLAQDPMSGFQGLLSALQGMQAEQQGADTDERVNATMESMMQLARYLAAIPGRKNIVWLSGSFPLTIASPAGGTDIGLGSRNYSNQIKSVTNLLAEAQVAVYRVDVRGLMGDAFDLSQGGMGGPTPMDNGDFGPNNVTAPNGTVSQRLQGFAQESAEHDTLTQVATATGGKAFYNTNGIGEAINTAVEQGSNYYSISYSPTNKVYSGKFRKIRLQLAAKGYTLHYRQGYFADDTMAAAKDAELARRTRNMAMQHGSPPSRQLMFVVKIIPVGGKKNVDRASIGEVLLASSKKPILPAQVEVQRYSIDYSFAGSEMHFLPLENAMYRSALTLMVTSFDREGQMLSGVSNKGVNELQSEAYKQIIAGEFGVHQEVDVPVEAISLRIGLQDQISNHIGTVDIPLPVPRAANMPRRGREPLPEIEPD